MSSTATGAPPEARTEVAVAAPMRRTPGVTVSPEAGAAIWPAAAMVTSGCTKSTNGRALTNATCAGVRSAAKPLMAAA